ncbi:MAG: class II D-tagatose-bisphosphate aldolase, non-catalytic subunit [Armatimonadetes bacterium]|nr:class II D-tagatose-bisphosphate aldolase, non-catalytic subunit [Armatimonadota bacterium]
MIRADESRVRILAEKRGRPLTDAILAALRVDARAGDPTPTVLAVCPNSEAVVKSSMLAAREAQAPLFFAATLNQVDLDGGYTGWTQHDFVRLARELALEYEYEGPISAGLDHGGPWLKDVQTKEGWSLARAMEGVKKSLAASLEAGYDLLHVDPTVDRSLPKGEPMPIDIVIERTLELIESAEAHRRAKGLPPVSYEVGTEEVHGGLADMNVFRRFLEGLRSGLTEAGLADVWPCFVVGKVGTDLHTTEFDPEVARELVAVAAEYGSFIKGHYSDSVSNPEAYPQAGMGGANVGPEFTEAEYEALQDLVGREETLVGEGKIARASGMMEALTQAVVDSGRWEKWRQPDEEGKAFDELSPERQGWLVRTGCRYIWSQAEVVAARMRLYRNLESAGEKAEEIVLSRIADVMKKYYRAFLLEGTLGLIESRLRAN